MQAVPLKAVRPELLFEPDTSKEQARRREIRQRRALAPAEHRAKLEAMFNYSLAIGAEEIRYARFRATGKRKGWVLRFHAHNGTWHHMGDLRAWENFDIIAPWDRYGWQEQGSWFWGEKGRATTEAKLVPFIDIIKAEYPGEPWFCIGSSMGGFAALYYGIKFQAHGIYVSEAQVDMRTYAVQFGNHAESSCGVLWEKDVNELPNVVELAAAQEYLPPLHLSQQAFDHVNYFANHALPLFKVYGEKRGWLSARILPGIGHESGATQEEAEYFCALVSEKRPPCQAPFDIPSLAALS